MHYNFSNNRFAKLTQRKIQRNARARTENGPEERVQAKKSTRGMPGHWEPKKDVISCEKLRLGANSRLTRRYPNGETSHENDVTVT